MSRIVTVLAAVLLVLPVLALPVTTSTADAQSSVVYACVQQSSQQARIVAATEVCREVEARMSWSIIGPQGAKGDSGPVGPQGPAGPQGPQGASTAQLGLY